MPDSIGSKESNIDDLVFNAIGQEAYFGFDRKEQSDHRRLAFDEIIAKMRRGKRVGNTYFQSFLKNGIEDYPFAEFIYEPSDDRRVPTLKEHYTDSQDQTSPLLIWRLCWIVNAMIFRDDECFGLLEIYRSVLLSKGVFKAGKIRTTDNGCETQKVIYHLALLTLNLGAINRQPLIGGTKKFPSWIRKDPSCVVLPHLIFKNGARIVAWCEASDAHGGIAIHQDLARDNAMLGMVVNAEITAPSLAIFLQGTHEVGSFIELLCQHQRETENKKQKNKFWILHGCIFRLAFGRVTSGEMVDPSSGIFRYMDSIANFHYS